MTLEEIILGTNAVDFNKAIQASTLHSAQEIKNALYCESLMYLPGEMLASELKVDPKCIWYTASPSTPAFYFNQETLAACDFPLTYIMLQTVEGKREIAAFNAIKAIRRAEANAAAGRYAACVKMLSGSLALGYIQRLALSGKNIPDLYQIFMKAYTNTDYGAKWLDSDVFVKVLTRKTKDDKKKTAALLREYPDPIPVYRGGNSQSTEPDKALSWTASPQQAVFFAVRLGVSGGYLTEGSVRKADVIEVIDGAEEEIIAKPGSVSVKKTHQLYGIDFLREALPKATGIYLTYKAELGKLRLTQASDIHGIQHHKRVLLLCLILADMLELPLIDKRTLATAAIYHDVGRIGDGEDQHHGAASAEYYMATTSSHDPVAAFLMEYHCKPDPDGLTEIKRNGALKQSEKRSTLLFQIFKDADALDRIRLSLHDLDFTQLRLQESKMLPLVAYLCYQNVE